MTASQLEEVLADVRYAMKAQSVPSSWCTQRMLIALLQHEIDKQDEMTAFAIAKMRIGENDL